MIEARRLTKHFGEKRALNGVSFSVPPGQVCGYLGPNGAGKSTTVKLLTGLLRPDAGGAGICGFDVTEQPCELRKRIGYVPESGAVYSSLSPNEYFALIGALHSMTPQDISRRSISMLKLLQIDALADQRMDTLSKGSRQRVLICSALLHDPDVVLFDEPLSGLDANAARIIRDVVRGLADRGKAILFCSHMLEIVERLCDRVIILHQGEIVAEGPSSELASSRRLKSLDEVFQSLTGAADHEEVARAFVNTVKEGVAQESAGRRRRAGK